MRIFSILLTFFPTGQADAMGPMSDAVQKQYHIRNVMSMLLSFFVFLALAVPVACFDCLLLISLCDGCKAAAI